MHELAVWLAATPLAGVLRDTAWVIPVIQIVHILAIALLLVGALIAQLHGARLIVSDSAPAVLLPALQRRNRWLLVVLATTGALMIISEPDRTLSNAVFGAKLVLIVAVLALSEAQARLAAARPANTGFDSVRALALPIMLLWVATVACGRWIAYVY